MNRKSLSTVLSLLVALVAAAAPLTVRAQQSIYEDFSGTTTNNSWWYFNGACLTASTLAGAEPAVVSGVGGGGQIPGCTTIATTYYTKSSGETLVGGITLSNTTADPVGQGALRFTNGSPYGYSENGGIIFSTPFATGQGVSITFKTVTYLGDSGGAGTDGADGISFFLMDASKLDVTSITGVSSGNGNGLGAWGGSLGYTCSNANPPYNGLVGAYVGLGIDEYGNFLNGQKLMPGYTGKNSASGDNSAMGYGYKPGRIGMRGAGNIAWNWLNANYPLVYPSTFSASQQNTAVEDTCRNGVLWDAAKNKAVDASDKPVSGTAQVPVLDYPPIPNAYVELPATTQIAAEKAKTRNKAIPIYYALKITQDGLLNLSYAICPASGCGSFISVIKGQNITTANGALPANFLFGFAGSTGGSTNIHEILCFRADPATTASSSAGAAEKQSAKLQTGVQAYFAYYNPNNGWTGRVVANSLGFDSYGNVIIAPLPNWDSSCVLTGVATGAKCPTTQAVGPTAAEDPTSRVILTYNGTAGVPFEYASLSATQQAALTLGDVSTVMCNATTAYANYDRVNYLRGDRSCEVDTAGVGLFRRRTSVLADLVDSSPAWVGPPVAPYPTTWSDKVNSADPLLENGGSAQTYPAYALAQAGRHQVVYAGANDGLMHGFHSGVYNTSTNTWTGNDGVEVLAYMPNLVSMNIHDPTSNVDFSNTQYGHAFYVDATPATGDLFYAGQWHTWLVSGLGPGGAAIFALDITTPGNFAESNAASLVIGEWSSTTITCVNVTNCGQNLGNTYGTPQIRRLHDGNWAFIFGNGLGSATGDAGIFIGVVNSTTATITFYYLSTNTASLTSPNGIEYPSAADLDGDHITDYVYAGDVQGNLWRFDLTSALETNWALTPGPLFKTASGQPITSALALASGVAAGGAQQLMVMFGTGQKFPLNNTTAATYATGPQALYGVWDWNMSGWNSISSTTYASLTPAATGLGGSYTLTPSNLQLQTVTINATTQNRDIMTNASICWAGSSSCAGSLAKFGWYLNLPGVQEQIIFAPELVSQALTVNSVEPAQPNPTTCVNVFDAGFTYVLSALTGAAFNQAFLPPSEAANPNVNTNQAYLDKNAVAMLTNATGSSFITTNAAGTNYLVYETNKVEAGANGANTISGGSMGLNLPPNTNARRLGWIELR